MSSTVGEPYQLYLSSTLPQKSSGVEAVWTTYNPDVPGYATVTAQSDGIHILDLQNLHAVASYTVDKQVKFAIPAFTLGVTEDGNKFIVSYAVLQRYPGCSKDQEGRSLRVIRHNISGSTVTLSEKSIVQIDIPLAQICGTGHPAVPLLFVSKNGSLFVANARVEFKNQLDWPGEREHVETFLFPRKSCGFVQDDTRSWERVAVTCCRAGLTLHVRVVLLGEEITSVGTCELPIPGVARDTISGLSCSPLGVLSFINSRGRWTTSQLVSMNSSLVSTPVSKDLHLHRFTAFKSKQARNNALSVVSLGTSVVLLAGLVEGTQEISLQAWDLSYGVLLAAQSMVAPSEISLAHLSVIVADGGQVLLTVSPSELGKHKPSSIYIVPVNAQLKTSTAAALGKWALTAEWLDNMSDGHERQGYDELACMISEIQGSLGKKNAQGAEQAFLHWVRWHSSKETVLGHEFVKKVFNIILDPESPHPYTPRITHCLLENAVVSTIMLNGRLITLLRQRGDWENLLFALRKVGDISEDELMATAKFLIDRQRKNDEAMDVDPSEEYAPPLWSYLFSCVSYPFSAAPMRLAIRKHLPDAQDLVMVLEVLEHWIQGGTENEVEDLLKTTATNTSTFSSQADSPLYSKVIKFLHALLDASFVALLQYPPSHELLRRVLSYIEPELSLSDSLERLRGMLEPFARAHLLTERAGADQAKEYPAELRKRKKHLNQQASLGVGLYRLEELVI